MPDAEKDIHGLAGADVDADGDVFMPGALGDPQEFVGKPVTRDGEVVGEVVSVDDNGVVKFTVNGVTMAVRDLSLRRSLTEEEAETIDFVSSDEFRSGDASSAFNEPHE